jgi:hypothetical protein
MTLFALSRPSNVDPVMNLAIVPLPETGSHSGHPVSSKSCCSTLSIHNLSCTGDQISLVPYGAPAFMPFYAADIAELETAMTSIQVSGVLLTNQRFLGVRYMITAKL